MAVSCANPSPDFGSSNRPSSPAGAVGLHVLLLREPASPDRVRGCEQPKQHTRAPTVRLLQSQPTTAAPCRGSEGTVIRADLLQGAPSEPPRAGAEEQLPQTTPLHPVCTTPLRAGVPSGCAPCAPSFPL